MKNLTDGGFETFTGMKLGFIRGLIALNHVVEIVFMFACTNVFVLF